MSVETKLEQIANYKTRHGIPLDQPYKAYEILMEGYLKLGKKPGLVP